MLSGELPRLAWREHGRELRPELPAPPAEAEPSIDRPGDRDLLRDLEVEVRCLTTSDIIGGCEASCPDWFSCSCLDFSIDADPDRG